MTDTITLPRTVIEKAIDTIGYYALVAGEDDQDTPAKQMQAALRAALAQQAEQVWQPIKTAPREAEIFIGKFIDGKFKFGRSEMFYEQANELAGEMFSGWVWSEDECSSSIADSPTHWMPLPEAPRGGV